MHSEMTFRSFGAESRKWESPLGQTTRREVKQFSLVHGSVENKPSSNYALQQTAILFPRCLQSERHLHLTIAFPSLALQRSIFSSCRSVKTVRTQISTMPWGHLRGYTFTILDLGSRWRWLVSFTPRSLSSPGKSLQYFLGRRLGGPQNRSGRYGVEKNSLPFGGIECWWTIPFPQYVSWPSDCKRFIY
jgi:hypothetical protein